MLFIIFWMPQTAHAETLASAIVSDAESYVGRLPYVYGGASLTTGADCSGFICAIYQKHGYNLWSHRTQLRNLPSSIATNIPADIRNALPGDIITMSSSAGKHVGIYAGGNYLINAANAKQGVVKKPCTYYGTLYAITRINGVVQRPTDRTPPVISDIRITELNNSGYTVTCTVTDEGGSGIERVQFPTWTVANNQDDLDPGWWIGGYSSGNLNGSSCSFRVETSRHNEEDGFYVTHIYAFDKAGNYTSASIDAVEVDKTPPVISDVQIVSKDATGYTVQCTVTDNGSIWKVQFPTWTAENGQDDLAANWWESEFCAGKASGSVFTFRMNDREHNYERGVYLTHIYAWDKAGNSAVHKMEGIDFQNTYNSAITASYGENKYCLYNDCLSWDEAKEKCEKLGGHLVTITSKEEQEAIAGLLQGQKRNAYWIGGKNDVESIWVTGEGFSYTNWAEGEPNGYNGENRYGIWQETGLWNDWKDSDKGLGFICEWEAKKLETPGGQENQKPWKPSIGNKAVITITFQANGGRQLKEKTKAVVHGGKYGRLPRPVRRNYNFAGWYTKKSGGRKITHYSTVDLKENTALYAKWKKVTVKRAEMVSCRNVKKKKAVIKYKKVAAAKGYEIVYSTDKKFRKGKRAVLTSSVNTTLSQLSKGRKYYIKVRAYKIDSTGRKVYGLYSSVKQVRVKK
ncbi:MAG: hypothetical protein HFH39_02605 [Lachnospiraceae bacterium]|nr:hypothetical protein [Lachnospiraceae bacterium]